MLPHLVEEIFRSLGPRSANDMIYYYKPIQDGDLTLSVDNIILDTSITKPEFRDLLNVIISHMATGDNLSVIPWTSSKAGTFRQQTLFRFKDKRSFWIGQGLVGNGTLVERCRLDANPNKVGNEPNYELIREFLVRNSREGFCRIPRFDLAIDIPVDRESCFLVKDRRLYIERRHGVEYTQYLGAKSSQVGRVKLYNKAAEAKLTTPLTRLELTLDPNTTYEELNCPEVYVLNPTTMAMDDVKLSETERFILNAVLQGCGKVTDLGRKTRNKIQGIMNDHLRKIEFSKEAYTKILEQLNTYCTLGATTKES